MECDSEFQELVNHNPFIGILDDAGYHVTLLKGYLVIYGLPYLDESGALQHGDLVTHPDLDGWTIDIPRDHQVYFKGGRPHDGTRRALKLGGGPAEIRITDDFIAINSFSFKLTDQTGQKRDYVSFEEKITTYLDVICGPAMDAFPDATPLRGIEHKADAQNSPLRYPDTLSSRYNMNDVSALLRDKSVAIIGLGGTGSYILDFLSKTHTRRILLYDADKVHVHTIFRFPGHIKKAIGKLKVDALAEQYSHWHNGIIAHPSKITSANIDELIGLDFVFVSVDDGPSRGVIVDWLSRNRIPFVDVGMGLSRSVTGLNGVVRITGTDRGAYEQCVGTAHLPIGSPEGGEYRRQGQIAEFNALNASLAVIMFKQHFRLLEGPEDNVSYIFETGSFDLDRKVRL